MKHIHTGRLLLLLFLLSFFCTLGTGRLLKLAEENTLSKQDIQTPSYRQMFYADSTWDQISSLSEECRSFMKQVKSDSVYFPVPESSRDSSLSVSFENSWMAERTYKKTNLHEGTDIMASQNKRGLYPVLSISDGTITSLGWLELGGWRVGVTSPHGVYYYYAHLDSYADIQEGDIVQAGQLLGFMGDSGYGGEGTRGRFAVHLHLGVYFRENQTEISVNPYYLLKSLESRKLKYNYS